MLTAASVNDGGIVANLGMLAFGNVAIRNCLPLAHAGAGAQGA